MGYCACMWVWPFRSSARQSSIEISSIMAKAWCQTQLVTWVDTEPIVSCDGLLERAMKTKQNGVKSRKISPRIEMWKVKMWQNFPLICSRIYVSRDATDMQPTADAFLSGCINVSRDATTQRSTSNIAQLLHWRQSQRNLLATNWPSVVHWLHQRQSRRDHAATLRNSWKFVSRDSTCLQQSSDALFDCCIDVSRDATKQQHCVTAANSSVATQRVCNGVATRCLFVAHVSVATWPCSNLSATLRICCTFVRRDITHL